MSKIKPLAGLGMVINGMRSAIGRRKSVHGSRHRHSQMKAITTGRFSGRGARFGL